MQPLRDLKTKYPTRRCQIFEDDYERARGEQVGELVPFFEPAVAHAIIETWEALVNQTRVNAGDDAELLWIEIHPDGPVNVVFRHANQVAVGHHRAGC